MAQYPRFLYSRRLLSTGETGEYVIHTIYPRFIAIVTTVNDRYRFQIDCWENIEPGDPGLEAAVKRMKSWFREKMAEGLSRE
jgi:hypothetical protein